MSSSREGGLDTRSAARPPGPLGLHRQRRHHTAAVKLDERFSEAAERLADHPKLGREGQITGTREVFPHEHYRLVYAIDDDEAVWILALVHTARLWPPI